MTLPIAIVSARSADTTIQVVTSDLRTTWNPNPNAIEHWVPYKSFPATGMPYANSGALAGIDTEVTAIFSLAAAQLPTEPTALQPVPQPAMGRIRIFACVPVGLIDQSGGTPTDLGIYTIYKTTEQPDALWSDWAPFKPYPLNPDQPSDEQVSAVNVAVISLPDGRLQLWLSVGYFPPDDGPGALYTSVQTNIAWNAPFSAWSEVAFPLPNEVELGAAVLSPIAVSLPNPQNSQSGIQAQLWLPTNPVITSTKIGLPETVVVDSHALAGWSPWTVFSFPGGSASPTIPIMAANDGQGRAYLFVISTEDFDAPSSWAYMFSLSSGPGYWTGLIPFPVPEKSAIQLGYLPGGVNPTNVISAAPLPSGELQLFYLGISGTIHTCWQQAIQTEDEPAVAWTGWVAIPPPDFEHPPHHF